MSECPKCGSPFHGVNSCPQVTGRGKKLTFRTRKEMGLKAGELPFKFRVAIDTEHDGETEVSRKRSLLRLNAQRIYMQMGCAAQASNSMSAALKWVARLSENMDEEDQRALAPLLGMMQEAMAKVNELGQEKIGQAVRMEETIEKERGRARKVRLRLVKEHADKAKKASEFGILRLGGVPPDALIFRDVDKMGSFEQAILVAGGRRPSSGTRADG